MQANNGLSIYSGASPFDPSGLLHVSGDIVISSGSSLKSIGGQGFQTLDFYTPAGANNYTALKLGGQEFFEASVGNRSYLYGFNSVGFKPTAGCSKAGSATIGFGDPADAVPRGLPWSTRQPKSKSTTEPHLRAFMGYNGILFTQTAGSPPPLGFWSRYGLGVLNDSPQYALDVSGDVGGTGIGDRITLNGTGYLLSGDSPAETQTLQQVCDNDNTTTTSILSTGPHISGVTGLFSDNLGIGTNNPHSKLYVSDPTNSSINAASTGHFTIGGPGDALGISMDAVGASIYHNSPSRTLSFGTDYTVRMTIAAAGNVGI